MERHAEVADEPELGLDVVGGLQPLERSLGVGVARRARAGRRAVAVAQALRQRLTVISGGPGTGKTSTVVKLLACVLAQQPAARIALAAPTGKAAQRLLEALKRAVTRLPSDQIQAIDQLAGALAQAGVDVGVTDLIALV